MTTEEQLKNVLERLTTLEQSRANAQMILDTIGTCVKYIVIGFIVWSLGRRIIQSVVNMIKVKEADDVEELRKP